MVSTNKPKYIAIREDILLLHYKEFALTIGALKFSTKEVQLLPPYIGPNLSSLRIDSTPSPSPN